MPSLQRLKGRLCNIHHPGSRPDIFLFATPRSGSTFLTELLQAQPGVRPFNEPLSIRNPVVCRELGVHSWEQLTTMRDRERVFERYFKRLRDSRIPELNAPFYRNRWRLFTNRNIFKVIHGAEDMATWFGTTFSARILVLLRHPIPTTLSHKQYPRLLYYLQQPALRALFTQEQLAFALQTIENGTDFEKGILNWCLQTFPLLQCQGPNLTTVTYEQLTIDPHRTVAYLEAQLGLVPTPNLEALINKPSRSTRQSPPEVVRWFRNAPSASDREFLIARWKHAVSDADEARAFNILQRFDIRCYRPGDLLPAPEYRISP